MITHFRSTKHTPANGVTRRPVPGPLAPERCVGLDHSISSAHIVIVGCDLSGVVRVKIELSREDASGWWIKVVRHWLAWCYGAVEIKIVS